MAQQAEALGVEIFPALRRPRCCTTSRMRVVGVATGNMGITKEGEPGENFQLGMELRGRTLVRRGRAATWAAVARQAQADRSWTRHPDLRDRHQGAVELLADYKAARPRGATPRAG